jgi:DNA-binding transcriptional MerR regulator
MTISIGELSRRSGVKVPTIRYYERSGLLAAPARSEKARREYQDGDVCRLRFIRHTRALGFETGEIKAMLEMTTEGSCEEIEVMIRFIEERIATLSSLKDELGSISVEIGKGALNEALVLERLSGLTGQIPDGASLHVETDEEMLTPEVNPSDADTRSDIALGGIPAKRRKR